MNSAEIRETFLSFFEGNEHMRRPSAPLIPGPDDTSTLLTVAGMQPFKPYFLGEEQPPASRMTSCQRCFRTPDIEEVGSTARHLTFFEMLGNFSVGDYFKPEAIAFAWELSTKGFGFDPEQIWITVFEGDDELGLGADEEAIELWLELGVPAERIVKLPRKENFWQAGPTGPCGPCSELYLDRGERFGGPDDRPGDDSDRFLEYWNLVFMTYELHEDGSLTDLPARNIDTGLGLERMAAILQGVDSVFETDGFRPLIDLAEQLSGRSYDQDAKTTRAMRILADHSRGMTQLIADGVVPSNEDRGYILRRIMRRAILQGRVLGLEAPYLMRFAERAIELLADVHPHLEAERASIERWVGDEEQSFGRTLERGLTLLDELIAAAGEGGEVSAADAFKLHDTFGFPFELTSEILAEQGIEVDSEGFEREMGAQRERARAGAGDSGFERQDAIAAFVRSNPATRFVGYAELALETSLAAIEPVEGEDGRYLVKLEDSPFYAEGGGQVADIGELSWEGGSAEVVDVHRVGEDQALRIAIGDSAAPEVGAAVEARVGRSLRHRTMRNHTATHLLHAALRERLGTHVRQAGSAVRPDKLRFDFNHGAPLTNEDIAVVEERINGWIGDAQPVRATQMSINDARELGAMALFGEKYGDWVRVVEVEGVSRELCGGTHVANTAEIGLLAISSEGSSAANVRRIEAITGPDAVSELRHRSEQLAEAGELLGNTDDPLAGARRASERLKELEQVASQAKGARSGEIADQLVAGAEQIGAVKVVVAEVPDNADQRELLELADRIKAKLGDAAVVLGGAADGKVALVGGFTESAVEAGASASDVVGATAKVVGGGGGGRPNSAQAGGRDPSKLGEALEAARQALGEALGGS